MSAADTKTIADLQKTILKLNDQIEKLEVNKESQAETIAELQAELERRSYSCSGPMMVAGGWAADRFATMMHDGHQYRGHRTIDEAIDEFRLLARMSGLA